MQVDGPSRKKGKPKSRLMEVVTINMNKCNLLEDLAQDRSEWRNKIHVATPTQLGQGFNDDDDDD